MRLPFALALAWREGRSSWRRIGLYMGAIALGVAALVAINSFRENVLTTLRAEGRTLLGADVRLRSDDPFPEPVLAVLDSVEAAGVSVSYQTRLGSMVLAPATGRTRLMQVRLVSGKYPYYGDVVTEPADHWPPQPGGREALVDPAVLVQLDAAVGDSLAIGNAVFRIAATVADVAGDVGVQSAIGPRVFIHRDFGDETGLIQVGSLVRYHAYLGVAAEEDAETFVDANRELLREEQVRSQTADGHARSLTRTLGTFGDFLGLVSLMALLLGGVGVASAVHVFIREKLPGIAVLRCLGARQRSVFLAYLVQAGALGLGGALVGALLGLVVQLTLPYVVGGLLPVDVAFQVHWPAVMAGLAVGLWVAVMFALLPLLAVRDVAPLQALRRDFEPVRARWDAWRLLAYAGLAASVVLLSVWQAPSRTSGLAFAAGLGGTLVVLWISAILLVHATRRLFPRGAAYVLRQGIANLFRPRNQTVAVTLALGFGVFLVVAIYLIEFSLLEQVRVDSDAERPNMLLFDIQRDQVEGVEQIVSARGFALRELTPIVPARISALNGRTAAELLEDGRKREERPSRWALRREYRNTYRASLTDTETLAAGEWWVGDDVADNHGGDRLPRISVETGLADDLHVGVGDRITWDVQGVPIETQIASLRTVDWARFSPNFFVVFEPGVLERAPHSLIALARVPDPTDRAELQRDIVLEYPNVSVLDLGMVQETVDSILGQVGLTIRFLALFTVVGGLIVLTGALATSRFQRMRESALLKTLGGSRRHIRVILLTEYIALGSLAGLTGVTLATLSGWAIVTHLFELEFFLPIPALLGFWAAVAALTAALGFLNSREVVRRTPLEVLRAAGE